MKLLTLQLQAFGPFTNRQLDLSACAADLHLVYGRNEAGKSSALRAIRDLLFGIPDRTADNFVHDYNRLRIGGRLQNRRGDRLEFVRRKGRAQTLRDAQDRDPLDDSVLEPYLGAVQRELFQTLFGIDHEQLRRGGEELLAEDGEIGKLLFSAAGMVSLQQHAQAFDERIEQLFLPAARKPLINAALGTLRAEGEQLKKLQLSEAAWTRQRDALDQAEKELTSVETQLRDLRRERERLTRIKSALPSISGWRETQQELVKLAEAPQLSPDFGKRREEAMAARQTQQREREQDQARLKSIEERLEQIQLPEALLGDRVRIGQLQEALGSHKKAQQDRQGLVGLRLAADHHVRQLLQELDLPRELTEIDQFRLPVAARERIQELADRCGGLREKMEGARERVAELQSDLRRCEELLSQWGSAPDTSELRQTLQRLQAHGDLEAQRREAASELGRLRSQLERALAQLPMWSGSLEEFERLPVPLEESVREFEKEFSPLSKELGDAERSLQRLNKEERSLQKQLDELATGGAIPSEAELALARQRRDRGWELVRSAWERQPPRPEDVSAWIAEVGGGDSLAAAFQQSLACADDLADRLRREADRVAAKQQLDAKRQSLGEERREKEEQQTQLEQRRAEIERRWRACWEPAGIVPQPPAEMLGWLQRQRQLLRDAEGLREQQDRVATLERHITAAHAELLRLLAPLSGDRAAPTASLRQLADLAQATRDTLEERRRDIEEQTARRRELQDKLEKAQAVQKDSEQRLAAWLREWGAALAPLKRMNLGQDATTREVSLVLERLNDLQNQHADAEQLRERIEGIDADARMFEASVASLVRDVAPDLVGRPADEAAAELAHRLAEAQREETRRDELLEEQREVRKALEAADEAVADAERTLAQLCAEAGCSHVEQLHDAQLRSERRRQVEEKKSQLDAQLRELSGGKPVEEFLAEADQEHPDELAHQIDSLTPQIQHLEEQRKTLIGQIEGAKLELRRMDGSDAAAEAAERRMLAIAELEEHIREYAVLQIARGVLRTGVERYRKKNQGPILTRASAVFAQLTGGAFAELRPDRDAEGRPVLVGVRSQGGIGVQLSEMSDGTRDQLYLALRIASVENWNRHHEPLPLVVDDVLINFDDDRATAALRVLAELSASTQVIYFTHHQHVLDLTHKGLDAGAWCAHSMDA